MRVGPTADRRHYRALSEKHQTARGDEHVRGIRGAAQAPDRKPVTMRIRTTELLHKSSGQWRYAIDHASIGLPPPPAAKQ